MQMCEEAGEPHIGRMIHRLSNQLKRQSFMPGEDRSLTAMQKHVLQFILMESIRRDLYQRDVEEEFRVRRSTATSMMQLLERNGFIRRESVAEDARLKKIVPTPKAKALRTKILENIQQMEKRLRQGISDAELHQCTCVLQKMLRNLSPPEAGNQT